MAEARVQYDYKYKIRKYAGDSDIGFPYGDNGFAAEITVMTNRHQAEDLRHFMEWRLFHKDADLDIVLPLGC